MRVVPAALFLLAAGSLSAQDLPDPATAPPGALSCSGCHGAGSELPLDALSGAEIEAAMLAFRDGSRDATLMNRLAAGFSAREIASIAAWIGGEGGRR